MSEIFSILVAFNHFVFCFLNNLILDIKRELSFSSLAILLSIHCQIFLLSYFSYLYLSLSCNMCINNFFSIFYGILLTWSNHVVFLVGMVEYIYFIKHCSSFFVFWLMSLLKTTYYLAYSYFLNISFVWMCVCVVCTCVHRPMCTWLDSNSIFQ